MTDATAIHALPYPEAADPAEGHLQIEALAQALDAIIATAASGTYAARPAFGKPGRFYRQTDTGGGNPANTISFDTGSAWITIAPTDAAAAVPSLRTLGTSATAAAAGNDPRFESAKGILPPVRAMHASNVNVAAPGTTSLGGVTMATGDLVLLTAQSSSAQNGPWIFNGTAVAMTRPSWFANGASIEASIVMGVQEGSYADRLYMLTTGDVVVDTTAQTWAPAAGATVPFTNASNSWSGSNDFDGNVIIDGGLVLASQSNNTGSASISSAQGFRHDYTGSGGHTLTLPLQATGLWHGLIVNRGTGAVTVARDGSDTFTLDGTAAQTSFVLEPGEIALVFQAPGSGEAYRIGSRASADETFTGSKTFDTAPVFAAAPRQGVEVWNSAQVLTGDSPRVQVFQYEPGVSTPTQEDIYLPNAIAGMEFEIINAMSSGSYPVRVRPATGEVIGGMVADDYALVPGYNGRVTMKCITDGYWIPVWPVGQPVWGGIHATTGVLAGAGDKLSMSVKGDGYNPMRIKTRGYLGSTGTGANGVYWMVRTAGGGGGTVIAGVQLYAGGVSGVPDGSFYTEDTMQKFTGTRAMYGNLQNSSGTPTLYGNQPYAGRALIAAFWGDPAEHVSAI